MQMKMVTYYTYILLQKSFARWTEDIAFGTKTSNEHDTIMLYKSTLQELLA